MMPADLRCRRGVTLLEVIVAMVILSTVAVSSLAAVAEATRSVGRWQIREAELKEAEEVLLTTSLLPRSRLDLLLGVRSSGRWVVNVQRPRPALYRIAVKDTTADGPERLVTVVYRSVPRQ